MIRMWSDLCEHTWVTSGSHCVFILLNWTCRFTRQRHRSLFFTSNWLNSELPKLWFFSAICGCSAEIWSRCLCLLRLHSAHQIWGIIELILGQLSDFLILRLSCSRHQYSRSSVYRRQTQTLPVCQEMSYKHVCKTSAAFWGLQVQISHPSGSRTWRAAPDWTLLSDAARLRGS